MADDRFLARGRVGFVATCRAKLAGRRPVVPSRAAAGRRRNPGAKV